MNDAAGVAEDNYEKVVTWGNIVAEKKVSVFLKIADVVEAVGVKHVEDVVEVLVVGESLRNKAVAVVVIEKMQIVIVTSSYWAKFFRNFFVISCFLHKNYLSKGFEFQ